MPPLRDRGEDVLTIADAALKRFSQEEGRSFEALTPEVAALFRHLNWPGNVRQLLNVIRHVVVLNDGPVVTRDMLPFELHHELDNNVAAAPDIEKPRVTLDGLIGRTLAEVERMVIEETIASHGGSVPKAARVLDVSPSTLYRKIESWKSDG
jgi:DNA-binding NtrC family response regulator